MNGKEMWWAFIISGFLSFDPPLFCAFMLFMLFFKKDIYSIKAIG